MDNNIESPCVEKLTSTLASKDFIKLLAGPENHSRSEHTIGNKTLFLYLCRKCMFDLQTVLVVTS